MSDTLNRRHDAAADAFWDAHTETSGIIAALDAADDAVNLEAAANVIRDLGHDPMADARRVVEAALGRQSNE